MGKRSKRRATSAPSQSHQSQQQNNQSQQPDHTMDKSKKKKKQTATSSSKRTTAKTETKDNLQFQDPFVDEFIEEDIVDDDDDDDFEDVDEEEDDEFEEEPLESEQKERQRQHVRRQPHHHRQQQRRRGKKHGTADVAEDDDDADQKTAAIIATSNPFVPVANMDEHADDLGLELEPSAYKMHHAIGAEWPSMTLDFFRDPWGDARSRFPHMLVAVVGTCGGPDRPPEDNALHILKVTDLARMEQEDEEEEDDDSDSEDEKKDRGKEKEDRHHDDEDDDDDDDDDEDVDYDPILEHYTLNHYGGVNRLRISKTLIASWSERKKVHLYNVDVEGICRKDAAPSISPKDKEPFFTYKGHGAEGFALDWESKMQRLATGDNRGDIHIWEARPDSTDWHVVPTYESSQEVEDLQWSPTETTVLAAAEAGGYVKIYDTRAPRRHMLSHFVHAPAASTTMTNPHQRRASRTGKASDVNAMSWNHLVTNLLATGCDDGSWSVWDLRKLGNGSPGSAGGGGTGPTTNLVSSSIAATSAALARFTCHTTPITSMQWHPTDESMIVVSDDVGSFIYDLSVEEEDDEADEDHRGQQPTFVDGRGGNVLSPSQSSLPPQLLFAHTGSPLTKEVRWHPQITSCLMSTALNGFSIFIPSNL